MAKTRTQDDQPSLPQMQDVKNEKVHRAALRYARARDERMEYTEVEKAAHNALLGVMKEAGLTCYRYGDLTVDIDATEKCKVKRTSGEGTARNEE